MENADTSMSLRQRLRLLHEGQTRLNQARQKADQERLKAVEQLQSVQDENKKLRKSVALLEVQVAEAQVEINVLIKRLSALTIELADAKDKDRQLFFRKRSSGFTTPLKTAVKTSMAPVKVKGDRLQRSPTRRTPPRPKRRPSSTRESA